MSMRIELWPSKFQINPFFQPFRDKMLQPLGFVVYLLNGIVQHLVQKRLEQPVVAHNLQCPTPARRVCGVHTAQAEARSMRAFAAYS